MSNLMLIAHPGGHPHPHNSDWLAFVADRPVIAVALAMGVAMVIGLVWRAYTRRS